MSEGFPITQKLFEVLDRLPDWLVAIIVIAIIGYVFLDRILKHKEKKEKQRRVFLIKREKELSKRLKTICVTLSEMNSSNNWLSRVKAVFGENNIVKISDEKKRRVVQEIDSKIIEEINREINEIFPEESTPVRNNKDKRIKNFSVDNKKRSNK